MCCELWWSAIVVPALQVSTHKYTAHVLTHRLKCRRIIIIIVFLRFCLVLWCWRWAQFDECTSRCIRRRRVSERAAWKMLILNIFPAEQCAPASDEKTWLACNWCELKGDGLADCARSRVWDMFFLSNNIWIKYQFEYTYKKSFYTQTKTDAYTWQHMGAKHSQLCVHLSNIFISNHACRLTAYNIHQPHTRTRIPHTQQI